jgi:hypothetical protein
MTLTVTEAGLALTDPAAYADEDRLHEALALLRRKAGCSASPLRSKIPNRPDLLTWCTARFAGSAVISVRPLARCR